ncbi:hypothetical protein [Deinococcus sp. NW-56]|uniref:hypothetical protein n=1 Tax=Deinococcus sp. NW-56 TaxID=2080419 RepID=UPI000CF3ACB0|nr:hypothetical protein [Deinococcus sp. NW-56]
MAAALAVGQVIYLHQLDGAPLPPSVLPEGALDLLRWFAVAAFGLASVCFSYYRTLDREPQLQPQVRAAGAQLMLSSILTLLGLVTIAVMQVLKPLRGAGTESPPELLPLVLLLAVVFTPIFFALRYAVLGIEAVVAVAITTASADDADFAIEMGQRRR